ncbi:unnamed protein product [Clonostachys rhizophaga]|uniref:Uncharacterized protein n=1 Tax=Clonostachys rhizophaga TaxID=160324 RepID=A0A9N9YUF2_9HYPO|nr:unnamed protein product [Clonostachys rhizophaga]
MPEGEERSAALMARAAVAKRKQQEKNSMSMPLQQPSRKSTPAERGSKYTEDKATTRASNVPSAKAPTSQASSTLLSPPRQSTLDSIGSTSRKSATMTTAVLAPHHHVPSGSLDKKDGSFGLQAAQTKVEKRAEQKPTTQSYSPFYKLPTSQQTLRQKGDRDSRVLHEGGELHETQRRSGSRGQRNSRPSAHAKTQPLVEDAGDRHLQTLLKGNLRTWFYYLYGKMTGIVQANGLSVSNILSNLQDTLYQVIASVYAITAFVCRFICRFIRVLTSWHKLLGLLIFICLCGYAIDAVLSLPGFRQIHTFLAVLYRALGQESTSSSSTSLDQQPQASEASMKLRGYMDQINQLPFSSGVLYRPLPPPQEEEEGDDGFQTIPVYLQLISGSAAVTDNAICQGNKIPCDGKEDSGDGCFCRIQPLVKAGQNEITQPSAPPYSEASNRLEVQLEDQWRNLYGSIYNASSRYTILSECLTAESQQLADLVEAMTTRPAADLQPTRFAQWWLYLSPITTRCPRKALIMERINKLQAIMSRLHSCLAQFHGPYKRGIAQDPIMIQLELANAASFKYLEHYFSESPRPEQTCPLSMPQSQAAITACLSFDQANLAISLHSKVLTLTSRLLFLNNDPRSLKFLRESLQDIKVRVGRADDSITPAKALFYEDQLAEIISEFLKSSAEYWI